jgi:hypothetical protein
MSALAFLSPMALTLELLVISGASLIVIIIIIISPTVSCLPAISNSAFCICTARRTGSRRCFIFEVVIAIIITITIIITTIIIIIAAAACANI